MLKFRATRKETEIINKIAHRAAEMAEKAGIAYPVMDAMMDIEATHYNGNPLRLAELLAADDVNFGHDVFGIRRFLDRHTGKLTGCFSPRYSVPEA